MPKLRYMVDRRAVIEGGAVVRYEPIGVWVHTLPNGLDVFYVDGVEPMDEYGMQVLNKLVEDGVINLPADLLEHHRDSRSAYHASCGPIVETDDYPNADVCGAAILAKLQEEEDR